MASKRKPAMVPLAEVRRAVADYIATEGCGCCRGNDHEAYQERLGKMLLVQKYSDCSGRNFSKFRSK